MSISKKEFIEIISKYFKCIPVLVIGFIIGYFLAPNDCKKYEKLLDSLEKGGKLAECIPSEFLDSGTELYLTEICHFVNRLDSAVTASSTTHTIRIHEADADALVANLTLGSTATNQTQAVVFSIPEMFKILMQATNVTRISETQINLENTGIGIVFGQYPNTAPVYIPNTPSGLFTANAKTCYVEFVKLDNMTSLGGNEYYEAIKGPAFSYPGFPQPIPTALLEPIMFNFPRLCPTYCPPSLQ